MDTQSLQFGRGESGRRRDHANCGLPRVQCACRREEGDCEVARSDLRGWREVEWQLTLPFQRWDPKRESIRHLPFERRDRVDEQPAKAAEEVDRGGDPKG